MDAAAGRCRFFAALAADQAAIRAGLPKHERISAVRRARHERGIWQRRFWEHLIRDEADYARHVEYCYVNPVKHGLVSRARDWPHSSFHRDVRVGIIPQDWAGDVEASGAFGER
jgi:putative transposase